MICNTWKRVGPQSRLEDKKLVSIRPTAKTGQLDYVGVDLSVEDQAMFLLFNEDR